MFSDPIDKGLVDAMEVAFEIISIHPDNHDTPDQLRLRIAAHNLKAFANILLIADDHPEVSLNVKQLCLGLLGTSDFLAKNLPEIDISPEMERELEGGTDGEE